MIAVKMTIFRKKGGQESLTERQSEHGTGRRIEFGKNLDRGMNPP